MIGFLRNIAKKVRRQQREGSLSWAAVFGAVNPNKISSVPQAYQRVSTIYACLQRISQSLTVPLIAYRNGEVIADNPMWNEFLREPYPGWDYATWVMMMTSRLLLFGSVRLVQENPAVLTVYPASPGERLPEKISPDMVYELALFDPSAAHPRRIFPPSQVIEPVWRAHFAGWQQIANSLEQGSVKRGFLRKKTPSASPEERGQLIQKVREALSTAEQAGRPLYLEGDVDWVEIAQSLIDSGVLETLGRTREEIGQVFGVPPALLSSAENRYANYREQLLAFYEWTLRPLWRLLAGGLTNFLSTRPQLQGVIDRVEFGEQDCWLVSELQLQNALAIRNLTGVPIMTINEGRELAGLPPFESPMADQLWMPISLYPVGGSSGESTEQQTRILVQSPKKEIRLLKWQAYERQRAGWERQMAKKVGKLLDEILQETLDNLPDLIKTKTITVPYDQQKAIDRAVKIRMALYPAMWADGIENGRVKVGRMEQAEDRALRPEAIVELRKRAKAFAEKVDTETAKKLREILEQGFAENWELDDFVKAVQQSIVLDWSRAIRIARTEVGGCLNGGELQFYRDEGIEKKEWLATQDDRVRDPHLEADGQIVLATEPFIVFGEPLQYPGDPAGSPENIVNCRCTILPA